MKYRSRITRAGLLVLLCATSSCTSTVVVTNSLDPNVFRLAAQNTHPLKFQVILPLEFQRTLGHQYLFLLLPFGRVSLNAPAEALQRAAYRELANRGYRPTISHATNSEPVDLSIRITSLSLTGYDLLFLRRVVGKICVQVEQTDNAGLAEEQCAAEAQFQRYAFDQELGAVFDSVVRRVMKAALNLSPKQT